MLSRFVLRSALRAPTLRVMPRMFAANTSNTGRNTAYQSGQLQSNISGNKNQVKGQMKIRIQTPGEAAKMRERDTRARTDKDWAAPLGSSATRQPRNVRQQDINTQEKSLGSVEGTMGNAQQQGMDTQEMGLGSVEETIGSDAINQGAQLGDADRVAGLGAASSLASDRQNLDSKIADEQAYGNADRGEQSRSSSKSKDPNDMKRTTVFPLKDDTSRAAMREPEHSVMVHPPMSVMKEPQHSVIEHPPTSMMSSTYPTTGAYTAPEVDPRSIRSNSVKRNTYAASSASETSKTKAGSSATLSSTRETDLARDSERRQTKATDASERGAEATVQGASSWDNTAEAAKGSQGGRAAQASDEDVVDFLTDQHQQIKSQFSVVRSAQGDAKKKAFYELRHLLAVHEAAEEKVVHPVAKRELKGSDAMIIDRLEEEHDVDELLAQMATMDVASDEFDRSLKKLKKCVLSHNEAEEQEEFSKLESQLDKTRLQRMAQAAHKAEEDEPKHGHAGF